MKSGKLTTWLETDSAQLRMTLPIQVRDSELALVRETKRGDTVDLDPGWYEVSAVLDDGRARSQLVEIKSGEDTEVSLGLSDAKSSQALAQGFDGLEALPERPELIDIVGATAVARADRPPKPNYTSGETWWFTHKPLGSGTPSVKIALDGVTRSISLPINPEGHGSEAFCFVSFERYADGSAARAWVSPARIVSSAVQQMLARGRTFTAHTVVDASAEQLLYDKYRDPVGAVLGALVLYQAGVLQKRLGWLENLARDFTWLPDGRILLGALLLRDQATEQRAISLLLGSGWERPMFTLTFSVLLDVLRTWQNRSLKAKAALNDVALMAARVDWSASTFTLREDG